jgi:hypothetical protein
MQAILKGVDQDAVWVEVMLSRRKSETGTVSPWREMQTLTNNISSSIMKSPSRTNQVYRISSKLFGF